MKIECIGAEADRYLPVLVDGKEDKQPEVSETPERDVNNTPVVENAVPETENGDVPEKQDVDETPVAPETEKGNVAENEEQDEISETTDESVTNATVSRPSVIDRHFAVNGFIVAESSVPQTIAGLKDLTYRIGANYSRTAPFLRELRKAICNPNSKGDRNICYRLEKSTGNFFHDLCGKMKQYGLFTKYFINGNVLTATVSPVPRVIAYLNGQWLEMYASFILEDVVSEFSKGNGYGYEILTNVKVKNANSAHVYAHEVDCVISIDEKCFAFEMKSGGQFDDYSGLYQTRRELHFVPDRYLLLSTELDEDSAEVLQYFYEFYITGMKNFRSRLVEMINRAFAK